MARKLWYDRRAIVNSIYQATTLKIAHIFILKNIYYFSLLIMVLFSIIYLPIVQLILILTIVINPFSQVPIDLGTYKQYNCTFRK